MDEHNSIFSKTINSLNDEFIANKYSSFRSKQLFAWIYQKNVYDVNLMSDLGKEFKSFLTDNYSFDLLEIVNKQVSKDGTHKLLFKCFDGSLIETVIMQHNYGYSVCVSSQVGCLMGCKFCASGLLKKERSLSAGEMVLQVLQAQSLLNGARISNVVVMGTGEPFDNYSEVMDFLSIINSDLGLAIGARHITVSTCGVVPGILKFKDEKPYNLAISLHAANNQLRDKLMPINQKYPLEKLREALLAYQEVKNRRLSMEYILLKGVNDKPSDAADLAKFLKPLNQVYVNLIPYNQVNEFGFQGVDDFSALKFYDLLKKEGVAVTLRNRHGDDIDAACGQLRNKYVEVS